MFMAVPPIGGWVLKCILDRGNVLFGSGTKHSNL